MPGTISMCFTRMNSQFLKPPCKVNTSSISILHKGETEAPRGPITCSRHKAGCGQARSQMQATGCKTRAKDTCSHSPTACRKSPLALQEQPLSPAGTGPRENFTVRMGKTDKNYSIQQCNSYRKMKKKNKPV